jgi:hypothetical protein
MSLLDKALVYAIGLKKALLSSSLNTANIPLATL